MITRLTLAAALALLNNKYGVEVLPALIRTGAVSCGDVQVTFADYRGIKGYDPIVAVGVYKGEHGHMVERFNITF